MKDVNNVLTSLVTAGLLEYRIVGEFSGYVTEFRYTDKQENKDDNIV